jgi:hypothetical protein
MMRKMNKNEIYCSTQYDLSGMNMEGVCVYVCDSRVLGKTFGHKKEETDPG